ncbi:MAG TPA: DUF2191 domain-containing protein, partial [Thermoanaerobaculia bacterium]|nr:DUF2191 domain-containing protein [Thermoanaerobaculia bacterium]
ISPMRITVEISAALFNRIRRMARERGRSVSSLAEEGLRLVLDARPSAPRYRLLDRSVGKKGGDNPLASLSWEELREEIYGGR